MADSGGLTWLPGQGEPGSDTESPGEMISQTSDQSQLTLLRSDAITHLDVGSLLLADLRGQEVVFPLEGDLLGVGPATRLQHRLPAPAELSPREPVAEEHDLHAVLPALPGLVVPQVVHVDHIGLPGENVGGNLRKDPGMLEAFPH